MIWRKDKKFQIRQKGNKFVIYVKFRLWWKFWSAWNHLSYYSHLDEKFQIFGSHVPCHYIDSDSTNSLQAARERIENFTKWYNEQTFRFEKIKKINIEE